MSKGKKSSHPALVMIVQHSIRIARYLLDTSEESFMERDLNYDAIMKQLDLLGEQVTQLQNNDPDKIILKFTNVPWAQLRSIRNRSTHNYFTVEPHLVWQFLNTELPAIERELRQIIEQRYRISSIEDY